MRERLPLSRSTCRLLWPVLALLLVACQSGTDDDDPRATGDAGTMKPEEPHALAAIVIGESHSALGGTAAAYVGVSFSPDSVLGTQCRREVAGCWLPERADCGDSCDDDQYCALDASCESVCLDFCDKDCEDDEVCYFASPSTPACRKLEDFDGGAITFTGTTVPVTLYPPYSFDGSDTGSLFVSGADLGVVATGASSAGFQAFDKTFAATTLLQTSPSLDDLTIPEIFGSGDVAVGWRPEDDEIWISATVRSEQGSSSTLLCEAEDNTGSFDIPRQAIDAALDDEDLDTMSIEVARVRREVFKDLRTVGSLVATTVQEEGWLDVSTRSAESAYFEGCPGSEAFCSTECTDLRDDAENCGECGHDCGGDECSQGTCAGPMACDQCSTESIGPGGQCQNEHQACQANSECVALGACMATCTDQACIQECSNEHSTAVEIYNAKIYCWCLDACPTECGPLCS